MKASVLINNYNYGQYLNACIDSVLHQVGSDVDVIVYDDGSSDDSAERICAYGDEITSILAENFGKFPSYNQGRGIHQAFLQSKGDVIFLLDSDDVFHANKVSRVLQEFDADPDVIMVQHKFREIDESGEPTGFIRNNILLPSNYLSAIRMTGRLECLFMQTSALAFRRTYLDKVLPLPVEDEFEKVWPDVRLTRQAVFHGTIKTINTCLADYRVHGSNDSDKVKDRAYFESFRAQQYTFYNNLAREFNKPQLSFKQGRLFDLIGKLKIVLSMLLSKNSFSVKWSFINRLALKR